jgi:hypothetical protein
LTYTFANQNHRLHDEFFRFQKTPVVEEGRLLLHQILGALEQKLFDAGGPKVRKHRQDEDEGMDDDLVDEGEVVINEEEFGS